MPPSAEDRVLIERQLGRPARALVAVAARCPAGHPAVIETRPLLPDSQGAPRPMPTLFWLVCRQVRRAVSRVEEAGGVAALERRLREDPDLRADYLQAHGRYRAKLADSFTPDERAQLAARGHLDRLLTLGIGGIRNFEGVKCLHLHVAHHLADANPLGRIVMDEMGVELCAQAALT